jgi:4-hydroxy-tetrahydrodipicolinate reductase
MASTPPIRLLINGARGRMGARIEALARQDARFSVIAAVDRDDVDRALALEPGSIDAIIDFSSNEGAASAATLATRHGAALLVGTTGLSDASRDAVQAAARAVPAMIAPNTSLGVAVLGHLIAEAARLLGPEFNIDLIESHHAMKRDAPSGTALRLAQALKDRASIELGEHQIHCIRAGDIIGEHALQFAGPGERITISHSATSRDLFARGALRAAAWLAGQPPGLHTIEQSLELGQTSKHLNV